MSKRLLIVASKLGYQTRTLAEAAERAGYEVQMATDRCHGLDDPWADRAIPLRFQNPERCAETIAAAGVELDGVVAAGDRPAHIAAVVAERMGLRYHPADAVRASRDKHESRRRFARAGLPVPEYRRVALDENADAAARATRYPCVLKPLGLSGSRGVIRADTPAEFTDAFARIRDLLRNPDIVRMHEDQDRYLQVEDFIPGREFALEGLMTAGRLETLAIFDKPDPLDGPFFEETIYVTPSAEPEETQRMIAGTVAAAVAALGLSDGPVHAEMRVDAEGVWMLEVAARPIGGLCARVLRFDDGGGLEEMLCRHAAGDAIGSTKLAGGARGVMMIPVPRRGVYKGVSGEEQARAIAGVEAVEITAKAGQQMIPLPEGASYPGFIFSRGGTPAEAVEALRRAHHELSFEIAEALPMAGERI